MSSIGVALLDAICKKACTPALDAAERASCPDVIFGVTSECGRLRAVLLHRPGAELSLAGKPRDYLWRELPDPVKARDQHDRLAELYRAHGVQVFYVEDKAEAAGYPNLCFVRDVFASLPGGAVLARLGHRVRAGEECIVKGTLDRLGIPICHRVNGTGTFEGADLCIVNRDLAFIAVGNRTNDAGAVQVKLVLEAQGIGEVVTVPLPRSSLHLDCALSVLDRKLVAVCPDRVPAPCVRAFVRHGFRILGLPTGREKVIGMAINLVAIEPGLVVLAADNPRSKLALAHAGVECLEIDISELLKGRGGVHCLTAALWREDL